MVLTPFALVALLAVLVAGQEEGEGLVGIYKIEGKVTPPDVKPANWLTVTTVTLDGGKRRAFLKEDNSFVFQGVTSGTFLVEVENPDYMYEQVWEFKAKQVQKSLTAGESGHQFQGKAQGKEKQCGSAQPSEI